MSPWIEPFLTALADTGSITRAACAAGISRRGAYARRDRDGVFALAWDMALRVRAAERERAGLDAELSAGVRPIGEWSLPSLGRPGRRTSEAAIARFLALLATSANVAFAARGAGVSTQTLYRWRRERAGLAEAWDAARALGEEAVETRLLMRGCLQFEGVPADDKEAPEMTVDEALRLLAMARGRPRGRARTRAVDFEAVRGSISRRIEAVARWEGEVPGGGG